MFPKYCSPYNSKNNFSCFSNESLVVIARKYNELYSDKITIPDKLTNKNRKAFWEILSSKVNQKTNCNDEVCWLDSDLFKNIDRTIPNETFRPKKPLEWNQNSTTWLSTTDINNVLEQYMKKYPDFHYIGAVPIDFDKELVLGLCVVDELCKLNLKKLYLDGIRKLGIVFNLDAHDQPGSHWVSMFVDMNNGGIYYFDSYAKPPGSEVQDLMERIRVMGNKMIKDGIIDINQFSDEHAVETSYKKLDNKKAIIPINVDIQLDTPSFLKTNKKIQKKDLFYVINDEMLGGADKKTIELSKSLPKTNKRIVQKGFRKFYNNIRFQYKGSECGVYSIHFQTELLKGKTFFEVIKNIIDDDTINKQRDFYYSPNNNLN